MNKKEALKILGLPSQTSLQEIKKRYRQLMHQVHPDAADTPRRNQLPGASQLNLAYGLLKKAYSSGPEAVFSDSQRTFSQKQQQSQPSFWNAPVNPHAYIQREVLQFAEDSHGNLLGHFSIARGKYFWTAEEDFPLFLTSIFRCSKKLLDDLDTGRSQVTDSRSRLLFQGELAYLLAQQFLDAGTCLRILAQEEPKDQEGSSIFRIASALELSSSVFPLRPDTPLYPSALRHHRLYLKDGSGKELGYLSFLDDRLYYVIIPLFEQRHVRLRIQIASDDHPEKKKGPVKYQKLVLWIKIPSSGIVQVPENLNLRIEDLLKKYKNHNSFS